jgi:hypothetical protein
MSAAMILMNLVGRPILREGVFDANRRLQYVHGWPFAMAVRRSNLGDIENIVLWDWWRATCDYRELSLVANLVVWGTAIVVTCRQLHTLTRSSHISRFSLLGLMYVIVVIAANVCVTSHSGAFSNAYTYGCPLPWLWFYGEGGGELQYVSIEMLVCNLLFMTWLYFQCHWIMARIRRQPVQ